MSNAIAKMQYTRLGNSGLKISRVILGAMSFGNPAWEGLLSADFYSHGDSERIIGKALKTFNIPRQNVTLLTKCYFGVSHDGTQLPLAESGTNDGPMVNRVGLSRKHILDAVSASVERLGTYIDVLQIHRLDRETPMKEIMRALNDVVQSGQMATWEFQMMQNIADKHGWHRFISMQNYYNLIYREEEREMIPYCKATGVGIIPWSPVARGVLARPWGAGATKREETYAYLAALVNRDSEADKVVVDRIEEIAKRRGEPMAAIATAWVLSKGANPVLGLGSKARIDQAVRAAELVLSCDEIEYLEEPYLPKEVAGY